MMMGTTSNSQGQEDFGGGGGGGIIHKIYIPKITNYNCINCAVELSVVGRSNGPWKKRKYEPSNSSSSGGIGKDKKMFEIPAALKYLFKLELNPTSFPNLNQLSLCFQCGQLLSTLYHLHEQFEQLTAINSFLGILLKAVQQRSSGAPGGQCVQIHRNTSSASASPSLGYPPSSNMSGNTPPPTKNPQLRQYVPEEISVEPKLEFNDDDDQMGMVMEIDHVEDVMEENDEESANIFDTSDEPKKDPPPTSKKGPQIKSKLKNHYDSAAEKHICKICGQERASRHDLVRHIANHKATMNPGQGKYSCSVCDVGYDKRLNTEVHVACHYMKKGQEDGNMSSTNTTDNEDKEEFKSFVSYTCFWCWKVFGVKGIYMEHIQAHLNNSTNEDLQEEPPSTIFDSALSSSDVVETTSSCDDCNQERIIILNGYSNNNAENSDKESQETQRQRSQGEDQDSNSTTSCTADTSAAAAAGQQIQFPCKLHRSKTNPYSFICEICGKPKASFNGSTEAHLIHKLSHNPKSQLLDAITTFHNNFTCAELNCGLSFAFTGSLLQHTRTAHGSPNSTTDYVQCQCNSCNSPVHVHESSLRGHLEIHARKAWQTIFPSKPPSVQVQLADCTECKIKILGSEEEEEEDPGGAKAAKYFGQTLLLRCPLHNIRQPKHLCTTCGYACQSKTNLELHHLKHLPKSERSVEYDKRMQFLCPDCGSTFVHKMSFDQHVTRSHGPPPSELYNCPKCPKLRSFRTKHDFQKHLNLHVAPGHEFTCSHCSASFDLLLGLKEHAAFYCDALSSIKPYECNACGRKYTSARKLKEHQLQKHSAFPRVYSCRDCEKTLKNGTSLKEHYIKVHKYSGVEARAATYPNAIPIGESERAKKRARKEEQLQLQLQERQQQEEGRERRQRR